MGDYGGRFRGFSEDIVALICCLYFHCSAAEDQLLFREFSEGIDAEESFFCGPLKLGSGQKLRSKN